MTSVSPSKNLPTSGSKSGVGQKYVARRPGRPLGATDRHGRCVPVRDLAAPTWRAFCQAFGHRLDDLMAERDVAATELAAATGFCVNSIHKWRRGARMPNTRTLAMLAGALGCALVDLLPDQAHAAGGVS